MKYVALALLLASLFDPAAREASAAPRRDPGTMTSDEYLRSAGLSLDQGFSGVERHELARGLAKIPECLQEKVRGLRIRRVTNVKFYGQRISGSDHISINPQHYPAENADNREDLLNRKNGAFVHEVFHAIGEWNKEQYYRAYLKLDENGDCPVSEYSLQADKVEEDFAEAARLLFVAETRDDRFPEKCVDHKLAALKRIFDQCR